MKYFEHIKRSLVKTITYRVTIIISTYVIVYLYTGNHSMTTTVTVAASITNTILYYLHERIWNKIHWGKHKK